MIGRFRRFWKTAVDDKRTERKESSDEGQNCEFRRPAKDCPAANDVITVTDEENSVSPADNFYRPLEPESVFDRHGDEKEHEKGNALADRPKVEAAEKF